MLSFCLHSLFREYGWQFFRHVTLPHPVRTMRAIVDSGRIDYTGSRVEIRGAAQNDHFGGAGSVVGVGFCLKPLDPPCISGRSNHDCRYLEQLMGSGKVAMPDCCRQCVIREFGMLSLKAGAAFYIMTSARDILFDLFLPAMKEKRFSSGLFTLCRYSFQPFAVGLQASGMHGQMFPFEQGDCLDYPTWLQADRGIKNEQTTFTESDRTTFRELLENAAKEPDAFKKFRRQGNILYPG